jgi:hypothetical protein
MHAESSEKKSIWLLAVDDRLIDRAGNTLDPLRTKRRKERRQRLPEKRCRGRNREGLSHTAAKRASKRRRIRQLERTLGRKSLV